MPEKLRLCEVADVQEGEPLGVFLDGIPALAVYNVDGDIFVTANMCTHGNAMLSDGYQDGDVIECPFHGGSFDIKTGAPKAFPCQIAIKTYSVVVDNGWVTIDKPKVAA